MSSVPQSPKRQKPQLQVTQKTVGALIKEFTGQANILTIPRIFISLTGDHVAALLLSQILYWRERVAPESRGWFYKSLADWDDELGLSAFQTRRALKVLERFGVKTAKRRVGGAPTLHYTIDESAFTDSLIRHLENSDVATSKNPKVKKLDNRETSRLESEQSAQSEALETELSFLTETTCSDTTAESKSIAVASLPAEQFRWTLDDGDDGRYLIEDIAEGFRIATGRASSDGEESAEMIRRSTSFSSRAVATIVRETIERRGVRVSSLAYFLRPLDKLNMRCHQALKDSASGRVGAGVKESRTIQLRRVRQAYGVWLTEQKPAASLALSAQSASTRA